jgi:hypothetical protein
LGLSGGPQSNFGNPSSMIGGGTTIFNVNGGGGGGSAGGGQGQPQQPGGASGAGPVGGIPSNPNGGTVRGGGAGRCGGFICSGFYSAITGSTIQYGMGGSGSQTGYGAGGNAGNNQPGSAGVVFIKYLGSQRGLGGNGVTTVGTFTLHTFTSPGTYVA